MERADDAFAAWIAANRGDVLRFKTRKGNVDTAIPVFVQFEDADPDKPLALPLIFVHSEKATERSDKTGNFDVETSIELLTHDERTTRAQLRKWAGRLGALLFRSDLPTQLNALQPVDFTAKFWTRGETERITESEMFPSESILGYRFTGVLYCFPS